MPTPQFYCRPRFVIEATILLLLAFAIYRSLRPTPYELYERIEIGDRFSKVTRWIGRPLDSHVTTNGTDYVFLVSGEPNFLVSVTRHRIVRVHAGRVVSKGVYWEYYNDRGMDNYRGRSRFSWLPKDSEVSK